MSTHAKHQTATQPLNRRTAMLFSALLLAPLALAGCNTVSGLGEDVEAAGGAIEESAEKNKKY